MVYTYNCHECGQETRSAIEIDHKSLCPSCYQKYKAKMVDIVHVGLLDQQINWIKKPDHDRKVDKTNQVLAKKLASMNLPRVPIKFKPDLETFVKYLKEFLDNYKDMQLGSMDDGEFFAMDTNLKETLELFVNVLKEIGNENLKDHPLMEDLKVLSREYEEMARNFATSRRWRDMRIKRDS